MPALDVLIQLFFRLKLAATILLRTSKVLLRDHIHECIYDLSESHYNLLLMCFCHILSLAQLTMIESHSSPRKRVT